jgi:hypothetical protein
MVRGATESPFLYLFLKMLEYLGCPFLLLLLVTEPVLILCLDTCLGEFVECKRNLLINVLR